MVLGFIPVGLWQLLIVLALAALVIVPICIVVALLVKKPNKSSPARGIICRKCGVENLTGAKFCTGCGSILGGGTSTGTSFGGSVSAKPRISPTIEWTCPNCGGICEIPASIAEGQHLQCPYCNVISSYCSY